MSLLPSDDSFDDDRDNGEEDELFFDEAEEPEEEELPLDPEIDLELEDQLAAKAVRAELSSEEQWRARLADADPQQAKPYSMRADFQPGDLIHHANFGLGYVVKRPSPRKIQVVFSSGTKYLAINYLALH